jgi:cyclopropane-fatty-acyl-phospholipid synthase
MNETTVGMPVVNRSLTRSRLGRFVARRIPQITTGALHLSLPDGDVIIRRSEVRGPEAIIEVSSWIALLRILLDGEQGFADAYLAGEWSTPDLKAVLSWGMANEQVLARAGSGTWFSRLQNRIRHFRRENTKDGSRRNIAAHYDLGNSFYEAWLDAGMNYSSAMYARDDTLELAQNRKLDRVIEMLGLEGGERVIEIGFGWGSLAQRIASKGCHVTGLTLSREQLEYAQGRIKDAVDFRIQDYRDAVGRYDRVASVEMIEAVGERFWPAYFSKISGILEDGGIAVLQAITIDEKRFVNYRKNPDFIQRYIFPGGMLPTGALIRGLASAYGLKLVEEEAFGMSYARTLAEWQDRFDRAWPRIEGMGFDQRFRRMWDYYLAYCEVGFCCGSIDVSLFKFVR